MERAGGTSLRLDIAGSGSSSPRTTESRPAVETFIRAAIAEAANDLVQDAEQHPYPKVGEPVIVDNALMATWVGEEWDDGTSQQITPMDTGDIDSW